MSKENSTVLSELKPLLWHILDDMRKKIRMFCFNKSWYGLFLWLTNEEEMKVLNDGLSMIERRRKILGQNAA